MFPSFTSSRTAGLLLGLLLAGGVACGGPAPAPTADGAHDHGSGQASEPVGPLARLFANYGADFEPAPTFRALAEKSAVVVTGRLEEIREGRVLGTTPDDRMRAGTLIHVFTVTRVLKGDHPGDRVFVETTKPGRDAAGVYDAARPPGGEAVLYLVPRTDRPGAPVTDLRAGLDPGATALRPTTPQGYLLLEAGSVVAPLAVRIPYERLFPGEKPDGHDLHTWLPPTP